MPGGLNVEDDIDYHEHEPIRMTDLEKKENIKPRAPLYKNKQHETAMKAPVDKEDLSMRARKAGI